MATSGKSFKSIEHALLPRLESKDPTQAQKLTFYGLMPSLIDQHKSTDVIHAENETMMA